MHRGRELIGVEVVEASSGRALGTVVDLYFAQDGRVRSLLVAPLKGIFRKAVPVPVAAFDRIEGGKASIKRERLLESKGTNPEGVSARGEKDGLCGKPLVTGEGKELGIIADVILDADGIPGGDAALGGGALRLWGFEVSDGFVMDLLDGRPVVEAAGARLEGGAVVLGDARGHMNLAPDGHATSEGSE